ncbi:SIR2 family protein [Mycobacterium syngnathidarum]|uniref:SIR2 family protein n=2 Tax=Mycobacteriaceae TaxID=1762 RepID=A0A1S1JZ37_9MYCO|nr:SIR2 family protein [Mycobacterium syngnathidarum]OLT88088.1 SIR2 family protein [Mycobacterium syngnathidarum]
MGGHLFIINGDLNKIACDAVLLPTDAFFNIESKWDRLSKDHQTEIEEYRTRYKGTDWDGQAVLPLRTRPKKPQVWLGNVGQAGVKSQFSTFAPTVKEFVKRAAKKPEDTPERIYKWPRRRLAVNVVGSGEGGGRGTKGNLALGLVETLSKLAHKRNVDIILVAYGEKPYAAVQWARRRYLSSGKVAEAWPLRDGLRRKAGDLAKDAIERQLVLFIGAGVSAGAGVDTWKGLLETMAVEAKFKTKERKRLSQKDLRDQATLVEGRFECDTDSFKKRVADRIGEVTHYSLVHGLLASLPSKEAVTTNFDRLFEDAASIHGKEIAVLPKDPRQTDGRLLLKLHGSVDDHEKMILTRSDYLRMPRQYGALMGLVQGLLMMRTMVFVGYSLSDEDFHDLIDEVRAARGDHAESRNGTVLTLHDDPLERQLWQKDLDTVPMVVDGEDKNDFPSAARQLEIFLDLVGHLATTSAAFFLDDSYADLAKTEYELVGPLKQLVDLTAESKLNGVGNQVRKFLTELGADYRTKSVDT